MILSTKQFLHTLTLRTTFLRLECDTYSLFSPAKFIVSLESTGALPPEVLFTEAVKILEDKCERVITELS